VRKILVAVAIIVIIGTGGDLVARKVAEDQLASRVEQRSGPDASAHARIRSFPFVARLLAAADVDGIDVRVDRSLAGALALTSVELDLRGVHVDRHRLLSARRVDITAIDGGTLKATLDGAALSGLAHQRLDIVGTRLEAHVGGEAVTVTPSLEAGGRLVLGAEGLPAVPVRLPRSGLVPCDATSVAVGNGRLVLSCTFRQVPPVLLSPAGRPGVALEGADDP